VLGGAPHLGEQARAFDALFGEVVRRRDFDALWMETLRADSFAWAYLRTSPLVRRHFHLYRARGPVARPYVDLRGSFADYMRRFSAKTRSTWRRKARRLEAVGVVEVVRATGLGDIERFLDGASEISRTTYQFNRLGLGLRDVDALRQRLELAASRGWLRCYLLSCGGTPCCFMVGYQIGGRFYYADVGYDPAWSKWSVGTVLLLRVIEDLFAHDRPSTLDFGPGGEYKHHFGNDSYLEVEVLLFPRRAYPLAVAALQRACDAVGAVARHAIASPLGKARWRRGGLGGGDGVRADEPE
jgi:CelD/BcsL family acetyltransferase involved in cellulose biosynthesis